MSKKITFVVYLKQNVVLSKPQNKYKVVSGPRTSGVLGFRAWTLDHSFQLSSVTFYLVALENAFLILGFPFPDLRNGDAS